MNLSEFQRRQQKIKKQKLKYITIKSYDAIDESYQEVSSLRNIRNIYEYDPHHIMN